MTSKPYSSLPAAGLVLAFALTGARADTAPVSDCARGDVIIGEADRVIDGKSFLFDDGREVLLAGIETPATASPGEAAPSSLAMIAKSSLEALARHRKVTLRSVTGTDRYGRVTALVFTSDGGTGETLVQRELLARGEVLLSPIGLGAACLTLLRAAERAARGAKLGLWADLYYVLKSADNAAGVLAELGRFAVVGGKVDQVRSSGGVVYVNFGRRWSEDFTVTILKRNERLFAGAGMTPDRLAGRRLEVRGFVEEHGGPSIEATRPEQIEVLDSR